MNDLGLNLDGPKPLKGVLNVLGSGAVAPHGGQKFATVLENRVQSDLSQVEAALENREPVHYAARSEIYLDTAYQMRLKFPGPSRTTPSIQS